MNTIGKHYAAITNPTIQAVVSELFRFNTEAEAQHELKVLKRLFVISRKQIDKSRTPSVHLWIKGYGLEGDDEEKGILGHFAIISYRKKDNKYVLFATKLHAEARDHPQRHTPKRENPNFGHPIIRAAKKGKVYPTFEEAQAELNVLHELFPRISLPNPGKLYIMIYCGDRSAKERLVKHIIEIKPTDDGLFQLNLRQNAYKPRLKLADQVPLSRFNASKKTVGKFTARVSATKSKKKPE